MTYCFQCGLNGTPEPAIGIDEDGEPACTLHRDKSIPISAPKVEPTKPRPAPEEKVTMDNRTCAFEGCEKQLILTNRSGYCTKHFYESKRKRPKELSAPIRVVIRRKPAVAVRNVASTAEAAVTVHLTSAKLDKFLCSLPVDVKHRMLITFLEQ